MGRGLGGPPAVNRYKERLLRRPSTGSIEITESEGELGTGSGSSSALRRMCECVLKLKLRRGRQESLEVLARAKLTNDRLHCVAELTLWSIWRSTICHALGPGFQRRLHGRQAQGENSRWFHPVRIMSSRCTLPRPPLGHKTIVNVTASRPASHDRTVSFYIAILAARAGKMATLRP